MKAYKNKKDFEEQVDKMWKITKKNSFKRIFKGVFSETKNNIHALVEKIITIPIIVMQLLILITYPISYFIILLGLYLNRKRDAEDQGFFFCESSRYYEIRKETEAHMNRMYPNIMKKIKK